MTVLLQAAAVVCALGSGWWLHFDALRLGASAGRRKRRRALAGFAINQGGESLSEKVLQLWAQNSAGGGLRDAPLRPAVALLEGGSRRWMEKWGRYLGRPDLTAEGLAATQLLGGLAGAMVSVILAYGFALPFSGAFALVLVGAWVGAGLPQRIGKSLIAQRGSNLERELPQMLAMVSLGLRGGLSFERSFALYAEGFSSDFAQACLNAQRRWEMSLATREEALRDLAASYRSDLLEQSVESMIRALRLGTALSENLEALAREARNQYRAACEEAIARAPVKMLVPTGTLILPAMLLLVMGPILLEMMGGF